MKQSIRWTLPLFCVLVIGTTIAARFDQRAIEFIPLAFATGMATVIIFGVFDLNKLGKIREQEKE